MSVEMLSFQAHVAVTEKFTTTNVMKVVTQLQLEFCKSIQHLFKYPTNQNHHNFLQNHAKSTSTWILSNHEAQNFPKRQICSRKNQGHADRSGDSQGNCRIVCPVVGL